MWLKTGGGVEWMGFRPSMPDSLPIIGAARTTRHVTYVFGHGHLGRRNRLAPLGL